MNWRRSCCFPQVKSHFGLLSDMDVCLSNFKGDIIIAFHDIDGNECSLQEHLKTNGIFSSQFHVYLKTTLKNVNAAKDGDGSCKGATESNTTTIHADESSVGASESNVKPFFRINDVKPGKISIKYQKERDSLYDSSKSYLNWFSMKGCYETTSMNVSFDEYNPFVDRFRISHLSVSEITSLPMLETNTSLPMTQTNTSLPITQTNISLPTTQTNTSHPMTETNISLPMIQTYTSLRITQTNTSLPMSQNNISLPTIKTNIGLPMTEINTSLSMIQTHTCLPMTNNSLPMTETNTSLLSQHKKTSSELKTSEK